MPEEASGPEVITAASLVQVREMAELIARDIGRQILCGELKERDIPLTELALMRKFKVSRPTLREAFRILESQSLITARRGAHGEARAWIPNSDIVVQYFASLLENTGASTREAYQDHSLVEPACVSKLAHTRTAGDLARLNAALESARRACDDPVRRINEQNDFHDLLVQLTGNQTLIVLRRILRQIVDDTVVAHGHGNCGIPTGKCTLKVGLRAHERLVGLIQSKDSTEAEHFWRKHIREMGGVHSRA